MVSTTSGDRRRARAVAAAARRQAAAAGRTLPADLLLWSLAGDGHGVARTARAPVGAVGGELSPNRLAAVLEEVTPDEVRQANGLHVTPGWLADELVALALEGLPGPDGDRSGPTVCDPACGGGAFLLAAARALHGRGVPRRQVVRRLVWGADVDPVGLAAAEAALALWAGEAPPPGRLVVGDPLPVGRDLWPAPPPGGFGLVVGNPPFLNQLGRATVRSEDLTRRLRRRYGAAVRPYTDTAWLFLLLACELAGDAGRVALVQPLSLVGARDAAVVRAALDERADLRQLWVERRRSFAAGVKVCAPVLEVRHPDATDGTGPTGRVGRAAGEGPGASDHAGERGGGRVPATSATIPGRAGSRRWAHLLADAMGVPPVALESDGPRLGDRATVVAGFRDEYYGLVPLVREAADVAGTGSGEGGAGEPLRPLVTAGVVDWGRCAWGERPTRFAKRRWTAPVVDLGRLAADPAGERTDGAAGGTGDAGGAGDVGERTGALARDAARWVARTAVPKVVVATQTRVVEAAVDEGGLWVPSVPTLAVLPHEPDDLWALAAALAAPTATAWLLRRAPETGLSRGALKVAAPDLAELPLPGDAAGWRAATAALQHYVADPTPAHLDAFAEAAAEADGASPSLVAWWRARLEGRNDGRPVA